MKSVVQHLAGALQCSSDPGTKNRNCFFYVKRHFSLAGDIFCSGVFFMLSSLQQQEIVAFDL